MVPLQRWHFINRGTHTHRHTRPLRTSTNSGVTVYLLVSYKHVKSQTRIQLWGNVNSQRARGFERACVCGGGFNESHTAAALQGWSGSLLFFFFFSLWTLIYITVKAHRGFTDAVLCSKSREILDFGVRGRVNTESQSLSEKFAFSPRLFLHFISYPVLVMSWTSLALAVLKCFQRE